MMESQADTRQPLEQLGFRVEAVEPQKGLDWPFSHAQDENIPTGSSSYTLV
jgi:hypothetical protein